MEAVAVVNNIKKELLNESICEAFWYIVEKNYHTHQKAFQTSMSLIGLASASFYNRRSLLQLAWIDNTWLFNSVAATAGTLSVVKAFYYISFMEKRRINNIQFFANHM